MNKPRLCREPDCWNYFEPRNICHIYCGSARLKIGCAYKNRLRLNSKWNKAHLEVMRKANRKWTEKVREIRNASRRTKEYHWKVKLYKSRYYRKSKLGLLVKA